MLILVPRHPRPCNAVAWNPNEPNKLVCGLEKYRSDYSVLLWDISRCSSLDNGSVRLAANSISPNVSELSRPQAEYGLSESAHSLSWFSGNSKLLACGMNMKSIKVIDFRDAAKVVSSALSKAVYGVCTNPHNDYYMASYIDHQINVWDTRNFDKPILTFLNLKPVIKLAWCPTK